MADKIIEIMIDNNQYNPDCIKLMDDDYNMLKDNIIKNIKDTEARLPEDILHKINKTKSYKVLLRAAKNNPEYAKDIRTLCALCKMLCQLNMRFPTAVRYDE
jgi:hypothetical protein